MEYRTTTKQDAIWALLRDTERKHVEISLETHPVAEELALLEERIQRYKKALKETEEA